MLKPSWVTITIHLLISLIQFYTVLSSDFISKVTIRTATAVLGKSKHNFSFHRMAEPPRVEGSPAGQQLKAGPIAKLNYIA